MEATLFINTYDSKCGLCNNNADPNEEAHLMNSMAGDGCGAVFVAVSSHYRGESIASAVKSLRPDLPFISVDSL